MTALFWGSVLPQLAYSDSGIHTATAALGAAVDYTSKHGSRERIELIQCYGKAVREIQRHFAMQEFDPTRIAATCLLLAFTDLFIGRETQALSHLKGTVAILQHRNSFSHAVDAAELSLSTPNSSGQVQGFDICDEVDLAGVVLDIGTASYALNIKPRLPRLSAGRFLNNLGRSLPMETLELQVLMAIHSGYTFAEKASYFKYKPLRHHHPSLLIDTGREIGRLMDFLEAIDHHTVHSSWSTRQRAIVLRMQCRSCLVYLSTVLKPNETAYDAFTGIFASIVSDAETITSWRMHEQTESVFQFSADLGTTQPLYLTAIKSRVPTLRQRAIALLKQSGRDGPFVGHKLAVVAQRAFDIENSSALNDRTNGNIAVDEIPEHRRIHGCGIDTEASSRTGGSTLIAFFSLCKDIQVLMDAKSENDHQDTRHWQMWREELSMLSVSDLDEGIDIERASD